MKITRTLVVVGMILLLSVAALTPQVSAGRRSRAALTAPTLIAPANGATVSPNPTFSWSAVPGAVRYHIQIAGGTYFDQQANWTDNWSVTTNSYYMPSHPEFYLRRMYWRVQAIDANNVAGPWSEVRMFTFRR